jgi:hypothetical protein
LLVICINGLLFVEGDKTDDASVIGSNLSKEGRKRLKFVPTDPICVQAAHQMNKETASNLLRVKK